MSWLGADKFDVEDVSLAAVGGKADEHVVDPGGWLEGGRDVGIAPVPCPSRLQRPRVIPGVRQDEAPYRGDRLADEAAYLVGVEQLCPRLAREPLCRHHGAA